MLKKIFFNLLVASITLVIISCSNDNNSISPSTPVFISLSLPEGVDRDQVLSSIDTTNVIGWFEFSNSTSDENHISVNHQEQTDINSTIAWFYLGGNDYVDAGNVFVNDFHLSKFPDGSEKYVFGEPGIPPTEWIKLEFPGPNLIDVESTQSSDTRIPDFSTTVTFPDKIAYSNVNVNEVFNKSNSIQISWNGLGYDYVSIYLHNGLEATNLGIAEHYVTKHLNNQGSITIPQSDISNFSAGYYTLTLIGYKLATVDIGNGKKIGYVIQSENTISVKIE